MAIMAYRGIQFWSVLLSVMQVANSVTDGFFEEPSDVTVDSGDTVTLSCSVDSQSSSVLYVYWYKSYGFSDTPSMPISSGRQLNRNVDSRYSVVGSGNEYHLRIEDVDVGDTSYYMCKYYTGGYFNSQVARLEVFDESLVPQCRYRPTNGEVGSPVTISCSPGSSATRPTLTLWRGTNEYQVTNVGRQSDGTITYRFLLKANDNLRAYTCSNGRSYRDIHNCSVTPLTIASTIILSPGPNIGYVGGYVRFSCTATGIPEYTSYRWFLGYGPDSKKITASSGRYIYSTNGNSTRLTIYQLQASDNDTAVRCVAFNDVGHRQVAYGRIIVYPPPDMTSSTSRPDVVTSTTTSRPDVVTSTTPIITPERDNAHLPPKFPAVATRISPTVQSSFRTASVSPGSNGVLENEVYTVIGGSVNKQPKSATMLLLPILLSLVFLLIVIIIILIILIRKTGRPVPKFLKRLWVCKLNPPDGFKGWSLTRPKFLESATVRRKWRGARRRLEGWQNTLATRVSRADREDERRRSIRDHPIEVLVNPPPPDWKFKVEDVTKLKRQRLISTHAPTGGYSEKEMDLLNSLITGNVKMTTLDKVRGVDIARPDGEGYDNSEEALALPEIVQQAQSSAEKKDTPKKTAVQLPRSEETKVAAIVENCIDEDELINNETLPKDPLGEEVVYDNTNYDKERKDRVEQGSAESKALSRDMMVLNNTRVDRGQGGRVEGDTGKSEASLEEEVIYDDTQFDRDREQEGAPECFDEDDSPLGVNYAELDLRITGPWDEDTIIQTEPKTTYAVIDHTKKKPIVETRCK